MKLSKAAFVTLLAGLHVASANRADDLLNVTALTVHYLDDDWYNDASAGRIAPEASANAINLTLVHSKRSLNASRPQTIHCNATWPYFSMLPEWQACTGTNSLEYWWRFAKDGYRATNFTLEIMHIEPNPASDE